MVQNTLLIFVYLLPSRIIGIIHIFLTSFIKLFSQMPKSKSTCVFYKHTHTHTSAHLQSFMLHYFGNICLYRTNLSFCCKVSTILSFFLISEVFCRHFLYFFPLSFMSYAQSRPQSSCPLACLPHHPSLFSLSPCALLISAFCTLFLFFHSQLPFSLFFFKPDLSPCQPISPLFFSLFLLSSLFLKSPIVFFDSTTSPLCHCLISSMHCIPTAHPAFLHLLSGCCPHSHRHRQSASLAVPTGLTPATLTTLCEESLWKPVCL